MVASQPQLASLSPEYFHVAVNIRNRWGEGQVHLGIPLAQVEAVERLSLHLICPLPQLPAAVRGVRQQRGSLVWVVDLGLLLGLPVAVSQGQPQQPALILRSGSTRLTCLVHQLYGIVPQGSRKLRPLPELHPQQRRMIQGMLPDRQVPLAIVDGEGLWAALRELGSG